MPKYLNVSGASGVTSYEIGDDFIDVTFKNGGSYRYTHQSAGPDNIHRMQTLARSGRGLSTFISTTVKNRYDRKLP